ncbi:hypothetical protein AB1Y20_007547 [Prymnesium parvum]|uniref:Nuclear pore complex protein Nup85 n=1 Tax=Prymnesium parvum TaxID=97485 RepID=A0AB34IXB4_PRYPA
MSSKSYTQRRLHAQIAQGQQNVSAAHPCAHSFGVSWGPGGVIAFGSRSLRVAHLSSLDSICVGNDKSLAAKRVAAALQVHKDSREQTAASAEYSTAGAAAAVAAEASVRRHKECAAAAAADAYGLEGEVQNALVDQHVWKALAALFGPTAADGTVEDVKREVEANLSSILAGASALPFARRREALLGWLALALWDGAVARLEELQKEGGTRKCVWALYSALQGEAAVLGALEGDGQPYLASLLAQPAECVRDDLLAQLEEDARGDEAPLFSQALVRLMTLLAGTPPDERDKDAHPWLALPNPWGAQGEWIWPYALAVAFERREGLTLPCASAFVREMRPPCDPLFHLLLLHTGAQQPLLQLPPRVHELRGVEKSWVRVADYSLSWHLMHTLRDLLDLQEPACAAALRAGYLHQLELLGCWAELHYVNNISPLAADELLSILPPPDEPEAAVLDLLQLEPCNAAAPLTAAAERLLTSFASSQHTDALLIQLHAAQALRARHAHRPLAELRQWLHALRVALARRAALCARLWAEAHAALLLLLPAEVLTAGYSAGAASREARGVKGALVFLNKVQLGARGIGEQPGWAEGGRLYLEYFDLLDAWRHFLQALPSAPPRPLPTLFPPLFPPPTPTGSPSRQLLSCLSRRLMQELASGRTLVDLKPFNGVTALTAAVAARGNALRRQLLADERSLGYWTAAHAHEAAALAQMTVHLASLPLLLRKHRNLPLPPPSTGCLEELLPPEMLQPICLPDILPQDKRAWMYRQLLDEALL